MNTKLTKKREVTLHLLQVTQQPILLHQPKYPTNPRPPAPFPPMEEESVASNTPQLISSSTADQQQQLLYDRINRALTHGLRLLDRPTSTDFFILGFTANVYHVTFSTTTPTCTCPDRAPVSCKHILFVLIKVLDFPLHDPILRCRKSTLRPCQIRRILTAQTSTDADVIAGGRVRERFHQVFFGGGERRRRSEGVCPVCLEEMGGGGGGGGVVVCGTCGNGLHGECLRMWKRSRGRRAATCVMCRSRWRERKENDKYVNLAAYAGDDGAGGDDDGGRGRDTCSNRRS